MSMDTYNPLSRRQLLQSSCLSFGWLAASEVMRESAFAYPGGLDLKPRQGDHEGPVKSVILLTQVGGPSQMDLFDPKPELERLHGKTISDTTFETLQPGSESQTLMKSPFTIKQHGDCGMYFSELMPEMASIADQWCMVNSMYGAHNNHPQAQRFFHSGKTQALWPTMGSWICYALGSENQNMPGFVVLRDPKGYTDGGANHWTSGWLPATFAGTEIRSEGDAVLNLNSSRDESKQFRERKAKLIETLNRKRQQLFPGEDRLETRIQNYELAARMQLNANRILDLSGETETTLANYGVNEEHTSDFGKRCLMARRMVEAGVRFVEVMVTVGVSTSPYDNHGNLKGGLEAICPRVDKPTAALIRDLKQRGLLESTLVIWSGEFGRLPISQNGNGRDHNRNAFTLLAAGGGFKAGYSHGATDEIGYKAVEERISVHDFHATLLHQMGVDHEFLSYPHNGRDERLTDPEVTGARIAEDLLA